MRALKPRVLITRGIFPEVVEALSKRFDVEHNAEDRPWPPDELARRLAGASGAMATVMDKFDEPLLAQCPDLKVISNIAVGYNNIDVPACTKRGIRVTNTPGVLDDTTADLTWSLLMAAARRIAEADAYVRRGDWKIAFGVQYFLGQDIHHATLGIIGMGRIGQAVARRARGFDMRVLYNNRTRLDPDDEKRLGADVRRARRAPRAIGFRRRDGAVLAGDAPPHRRCRDREDEAHGDPREQRPRRRGRRRGAGGGAEGKAHRGRRPRRLRGRAEARTRVPASFANVVLTPHIGSASRATRVMMCNTAAANMTAVLEGREPPNPVN